MSRIGKAPVEIPSGVDVTIDGSFVTVKGKLGKLEKRFDPSIKITKQDGKIHVERPGDDRQSRSLHGLTRAIINNMVNGVTKGFTRSLLIEGVGYRVAQKGKGLEFSLGYSHTINMNPPEGITFQAPKPTELIITGADKEMVGQVASNIRRLRPPEPYKGKGIRYAEEKIRRKAGKAASK